VKPVERNREESELMFWTIVGGIDVGGIILIVLVSVLHSLLSAWMDARERRPRADMRNIDRNIDRKLEEEHRKREMEEFARRLKSSKEN